MDKGGEKVDVDFFLNDLTLWILIGTALLLLIWGLQKKSWQALLLSGAVLLPPTLFLFFGGGAEGWFKFPVLVPLFLFVLAYFMKKRTERLF
jgi:hypothetical protein